MGHPSTHLGALIGAIIVTLIALAFARRQNRHRAMGGAISRPKQVWLGLAIFNWFVLAPLIAVDPRTPPVLAWGLGAFGAFMWLRGAAEMVMLYVTKNWRPPMGITHDVLCILLLVGVLGLRSSELTLDGPLPVWFLAYYLSVIASLVAEIWFAWAFFHAVEGKTTGHDGIWFADEHDPRFILINRVTTVVDVLVGGILVCFLWAIR
ncbi:MAG: hypothetical protein IPG45_25365 [Deltaproteobacteria bacterium]|nr:hypothetical protein [Deltaproteobacteria bacterium]